MLTPRAWQTAVAAREASLAAEHDRKTLTNRVEELQAELAAAAALASELEQKLGKAVEQTEAAMASADAWQVGSTTAPLAPPCSLRAAH